MTAHDRWLEGGDRRNANHPNPEQVERREDHDDLLDDELVCPACGGFLDSRGLGACVCADRYPGAILEVGR